MQSFQHGLCNFTLQSVAKRDSSIPCMVHDLSFPPGQSVNEGIARDEYFSQPFHLRLPDGR